MQDLIIFLLGDSLYNILLVEYPLFVGVMILLFTLLIILIFFKLMASLVHLN